MLALTDLARLAYQEKFSTSWADAGNTDSILTEVCSSRLRVEPGMSISRQRSWRGDRLLVEQTVHGLTEASGTQTLDTVRARARSCQTYVEKPNKPARVVKADVAVTELPGVDDVYTFCHSVDGVSERASGPARRSSRTGAWSPSCSRRTVAASHTRWRT